MMISNCKPNVNTQIILRYNKNRSSITEIRKLLKLEMSVNRKEKGGKNFIINCN